MNRGVSRNTVAEGLTYDYACFRADWVTEFDRHNTRWLLLPKKIRVSNKPGWVYKPGVSHIVQHNVRDIPKGRTLLSHVFFEVQEQRGVLFQFSQSEHVFQDDDSAVLVRLVTELIHRCKCRTELVFRVPILQFPECPMRLTRRKSGRSAYLCILPILFVAFFLSTTFLSTPCPPAPCWCLWANSAF